MQALDRFLNSCLRSLTRSRKIDMVEFLGAMAELELGAEPEEPIMEEGKDNSKRERQNAELSLLLQGENLELTAYLLAYLIKYHQTKQEWIDSIEQISDKFGLRGLKLLSQIATKLLVKGVGSLMNAAPDWMWEMLQGILEEKFGWGISEEDLRRLAGIVKRSAEMAEDITVLPGEGEDLAWECFGKT